MQGSHTVELMGPHWAAEYLANSGVAKDAKVLDCAAGSGIVAEFLRARHGFTGVIEGFDGSQNMLDKAALKMFSMYNDDFTRGMGLPDYMIDKIGKALKNVKN